MATTRTATATAFRDARILRGATDNGRYDAAKLARLLDWTISDIAQYLGRDASTISRFGASPIHQEKLAALASLTQEVFEIMREATPSHSSVVPDSDQSARRLLSSATDPSW